MGEAISVAQEAIVPNFADANVYDRIYTTDTENLAEIHLVVIYQKDGSECARRKIPINDGVIRASMKAIYKAARDPVYQGAYDPAHQTAYDAAINDGKTEDEAKSLAEKAGRDAGNQAVIDAGIAMGDYQAAWQAAQDKVAANATAREILKLLASKDWGERILDKAWAKESVE